MKEYIFIGRIVNTHGIKGELRILSDFEKKEKVFKKGILIFIGQNKQAETIESYRHHKQFEMIILKGFTNINQVLKYKGQNVYVERKTLELKENEYVYEELIGMWVIENEECIGKIKNIVYNKANLLLHIESEKNFYIPLNEEYVKKVDTKAKKVYVEGGKKLRL